MQFFFNYIFLLLICFSFADFNLQSEPVGASYLVATAIGSSLIGGTIGYSILINNFVGNKMSAKDKKKYSVLACFFGMASFLVIGFFPLPIELLLTAGFCFFLGLAFVVDVFCISTIFKRLLNGKKEHKQETRKQRKRARHRKKQKKLVIQAAVV